jgi:hypothetical protein
MRTNVVIKRHTIMATLLLQRDTNAEDILGFIPSSILMENDRVRDGPHLRPQGRPQNSLSLYLGFHGLANQTELLAHFDAGWPAL